VRARGTKVHIVVSDTGQGIHPDFLPHLFVRVRQADTSYTRTGGGLGLGLALVRHLVELHEGTVQGESRGLGQGAALRRPASAPEGPGSPVTRLAFARNTSAGSESRAYVLATSVRGSLGLWCRTVFAVRSWTAVCASIPGSGTASATHGWRPTRISSGGASGGEAGEDPRRGDRQLRDAVGLHHVVVIDTAGARRNGSVGGGPRTVGGGISRSGSRDGPPIRNSRSA
jgi:hypothetical protein